MNRLFSFRLYVQHVNIRAVMKHFETREFTMNIGGWDKSCNHKSLVSLIFFTFSLSGSANSLWIRYLRKKSILHAPARAFTYQTTSTNIFFSTTRMALISRIWNSRLHRSERSSGLVFFRSFHLVFSSTSDCMSFSWIRLRVQFPSL